MISLITHEDLSAFDIQPMADKIAKAHAEFTEKAILEALIARFGELPSDEEIAAHCVCIVDREKVSHYMWFDVKPAMGEKVDLSNPLCVIAPPKFGGPMS